MCNKQDLGTRYDCIVIGAGPGGLVATKELLEQGFQNILCLEKSMQIGGVFAKGYEGLVLSSSVACSMFSDFDAGKGKEDHFWSKEEAIAYWKAYATHFKVYDRIRFDSMVTNIIRLSQDIWQIELSDGQQLYSHRLIIATGNNNVPKFPSWKKDLIQVDYIHSKGYQNVDPYRGKNVLIVGGGESGSAIALEVAKVANQCWVSVRESTGWISPMQYEGKATNPGTNRCLFGLPPEFGGYISAKVLANTKNIQDPVLQAATDLNSKISNPNGMFGIYGNKSLALPKAIVLYGCEVVGAITAVKRGGQQLITTDGQQLEGVDAIIFCTGYSHYLPFMPKELQDANPRDLYKHMFHPLWQSQLAWIGKARPAFGSQFPIMEMQARFCALVFSGQHMLPEAITMQEIIDRDAQKAYRQFESNAYRIGSLVNYHQYLDDLAGLIGCVPPFWKYFFFFPRLWLKMIFGPTQGTQFRLVGPGKKVNLAKKIIRRLPCRIFNYLGQLGLRCRMTYAWNAMMTLD